MKTTSVFALLCIVLIVNSVSAQIDLSVQYDQHFSFRGGKVVGILVDAPLNAFSFGAGLQYAFLDDYAFLPTVGTMPDGTIGKGNGIGIYVNVKLFSSHSRTGVFGELSHNLQFIKPTDKVDIGVFSDYRDLSYAVMQPSISLGYLISSESGLITSLSVGYGIESFRAFNDETQVDGIFKMSLKVGKRFIRKSVNGTD